MTRGWVKSLTHPFFFESEVEFKIRNSRIHFRTKSETLFRPVIP